MISGAQDTRLQRVLFLTISVLLMAYTVSRAWLLSFTFDESYSYMSYVKDTFWHIFTYKFLTSNSHMLNSILMKVSTLFFTPSDFTLRLHSLAGHVLYLYFSWALLRDVKNTWYRVGAFLLLNTNAFELDFFSLARGYGLAMGCMIASLYWLVQWMKNVPRKRLWLAAAAAMAGVAALSNFTMINYIAALLGAGFLWSVYQWADKRRIADVIADLAVMVIAAFPFVLYVVKMSFRLKDANELYYGGKTGFWHDSVMSLIEATLYHKHYAFNAAVLMQILIAVMCLVTVTFIGLRFIRQKSGLQPYAAFCGVAAITILIILSIVLQHLLLGTYYVINRTAMLLIPLFFLSVSYAFYYLGENYKTAYWGFGIVLLLALLNFAQTANFTSTEIWREQADVKNMMRDLDKIRKEKDPAKNDYFLSSFWMCAPATDFYRDVYNYTWLNKVDVAPPTFKENYLYLPDSELHTVTAIPYRIIKRYPVTQSVLIENLRPAPRQLFDSGRIVMEPGNPECRDAVFSDKHARFGRSSILLKPETFTPELILPVGKMQGDSLYRVEASAWVYFDKADERPGELVIAAGVGKELYRWHSQHFERYFDFERGGWMHVYFGDWMPKVRSKDDVVKVSVYNNTKDKEFYVDGIEAKIIR